MKKIIFFLGMLAGLFLFTGCGGGGGSIGSSTSAETATQKSLAIIANYSQGASTTPTVADYHHVGATGVTEDMIADINFLIRGLSYDDVNSQTDIQQALLARREALEVIITYANHHGQSTAPTLATYQAIGVKGVDASNLQAINAIIAALVKDRIDTGLEIDAIVIGYVPDTTAPIITLLGDPFIEITLHTDFNDPGASATDDRDGTVAVDITGVLDPHTLGTYTLTYTARDLAGNESNVTRTIEVIASPINNPPTANAGPDQSVQVNTTANLIGTGSDIEGSVSYAWTEGAVSLSTSASFGYIPTVIGEHTLTLTVTDSGGLTAIDTVVITATEIPNHAPTAEAGENKTTQVNTIVRITGSASDGDGTISSYSWSEGGTVIATTAAFDYTPSTVSTHTLTLTVTDNDGATDSDTMTVTATETPNQAPTAEAGENKTTQVNTTVRITGSASDGDGTISSYSWSEGGTVIATTAAFDYTPSTATSHTLTLTVTDDDGATDSDTMTVTATEIPNHAPTAEAGENKTTQVNTTVRITGSGSDSDGSITSYEWKEGASILSHSAAFDYSSSIADDHVLTLTVTDDDGATDTDTMTVTVTEAVSNNHAPVADGQHVSTNMNNNVDITLTGSDEDTEDTLTYHIVSTPSHGDFGGTIAPNLTYTPDPSYHGDDSFTFKVNDNTEDSEIAIVTISVNDTANVPAAPSEQGAWNQTKTSVRIGIKDNADNEDGFRIYIEGVLNGTVDAHAEGTPEKAYTITGLSPGTSYLAYVVAFNAAGESDGFTKSVTTKANKPPQADAGEGGMVQHDHEILLNGSGSDEDGSIIAYSWTENGADLGTEADLRYSSSVVAIHTLTLTVTDDDGATASATVDVNVTQDPPPNQLPTVDAGEDKITQVGISVRLTADAHDSDGSIVRYQWKENSTLLSDQNSFEYRSNEVKVHTIEVTVTDNSGATATASVDVNVTAQDETMREINATLDFEQFAEGNYLATDTNGPATIVSQSGITDNNLEYSFFGIKRVDIPSKGASKAFCAEFDVKDMEYYDEDGHLHRKPWKQTLELHGFSHLSATEPVNMQGKATFDLDYIIYPDNVTDTRVHPYDITSYINLQEYHKTIYAHAASAGQQTSGYLALLDLDPGIWNHYYTDRYQYTAGHDNFDIPGTLYDIEPLDTGKELTSYAMYLEGSGDVHLNFCVDNFELRGTQLKKDIFDERYGTSSHTIWNEYLARTKPVYDALVARKNNLGNIDDIPTTGLSIKQDYQRAKLIKLKTGEGGIDDRIAKLQNDIAAQGMATIDVRRAKEFLSRYEATYAKLKESLDHPINEFNVYHVPAMKYGRLDGFTFPIGYNRVADEPYDLTMAKGEYRSIAVLLDPDGNYDEILTFANTDFSNGGVTLDKYIAKIWYQSGKDDTTFDSYYAPTRMPAGEGNAWLTQELLLKNDALIKIARDPDEKNMLYYKGDNYVYSFREDGVAENLGEQDGKSLGSVPGYVWISTPEGTEYSIADRFLRPVGTDDLLHIDDNSTIQPFRLHTTYKLLWGIIHVAKDASDGEHTANIEIRDSHNALKVSIPVKVNVLSYELSESKLDYGIYYHSSISGENYQPPSLQAIPMAINKSWVSQEYDLNDMYKHGLRYPLVELKDNTRFSVTLDMMKGIGYPVDKVFAWSGDIVAREVTSLDEVKNWQTTAKDKGFGDFYIPIVDEASMSQIATAKRFIRDTLRTDNETKDIKIWAGSHNHSVSFLAKGDYLDAPIISHPWTYPYATATYHHAEVEGHQPKVYLYGDPQTGVENPEVYRRNYGLKLLQEGLDGAFDYAYQKQYAFYWNDFDVKGTESNHREEAFTYPTTNEKSIGTIQWEGYRDAITDVRYITTLYDKAGTAKKSEIDTFVDGLDLSGDSDLDTVREQIIDKIAEYE